MSNLECGAVKAAAQFEQGESRCRTLSGWTRNVRFGWWSQRVDATLYLRRKRWSGAMGQGQVWGFSAAAKAELWDRWERGETLKAIGRAFGKPSSSIYYQLAPHGGIRPALRHRSKLALTLVEREEISRGIAAAESMRSMARKLGRSPSTVAREISRNGGYDRYRASSADETAWVRARRPKRCKLADNPQSARNGGAQAER